MHADPMQNLLDQAALQELCCRYARAIDRVDPELLASAYHPDAIDDHGTTFCGPAREFVQRMPQIMMQFEITQHRVSNAYFRIDGDRADGELYFDAYHRTKPPEPKHVYVVGRYLDNYERRDGVWKIAHRRLVWDALQTAAVGEGDAAYLDSLGIVGALAQDRSYEALPLMARGK